MRLKGAKNEPLSGYISSRFPDSFNFPYNPDDIVSGNAYDVYDEMRDDDQIKASLAIKKEVALSTGWEIKTDDEAVKEFWEQELCGMGALEGGLEGNFGVCLRDMLSCLDYGFSMTEPVYRMRDDSLWGVKSLRTRPPHTFEFDINPAGDVTTIKQRLTAGDKTFKPGQFIHIAFQPDFGNPYGKSDLRAAFAPWKTKKFMDRFYAIYMERYASPFVVGRYPNGTNPDEIARLHELVKKVQITTGMTLPEDIKLDIVETSKDASEAFERAIDHYNLRMARAILVPDLIGTAGAKTEGGSFALGEKQFGLFLGLIQSIRQMLARAVTTRLIRPLTLVNFGDVEAEFRFLPYREELLVEHFKTWADAVAALKVKPTLDQINHLNSALGFPDSDDDSMTTVDAAARSLEAGAEGAEAAAKAPMGPDGKPVKPAAKDEKEPPAKKPAEDMSWRGARKPSPFEHKMDFTSIEKTLDGAEADVLPRISKLAASIQNDFIAQVRDSGLVGRKDAERLNGIGFRNLRDMNRVWATYFEDLYGVATDEAGKEILPRGTFKAPTMSEKYLAIIRAEAFKVVKDWNEMVAKKAKGLIIQGMKDGLADSEIYRLAKAVMADESERWVATVVRTKTTEVYNEARKIYFETDPIASEIVVAYQWSSILDDRTSEVCRMLDGKVWERGEFADRVKPPAHFNCRSVIVPITRFEKYEVDAPTLEKIGEAGGNLILPAGKKEE